jgi:hypothetical protein
VVGRAAARIDDIDAVIDIRDQIFEARGARADVGIPHPDDRLELIADRSRVSRWLFARIPAVSREWRCAVITPSVRNLGLAGFDALVVVTRWPRDPDGYARVVDIQDGTGQLAADAQDARRLGIVRIAVGLDRVAERLVGEDTGHIRVQHDIPMDRCGPSRPPPTRG